MAILRHLPRSVDRGSEAAQGEFVVVDPGESATVEYVHEPYFGLPTTRTPSADTHLQHRVYSHVRRIVASGMDYPEQRRRLCLLARAVPQDRYSNRAPLGLRVRSIDGYGRLRRTRRPPLREIEGATLWRFCCKSESSRLCAFNSLDFLTRNASHGVL